MDELIFRERPATGEPAGLLVLHHGRGADENDLLGLADQFDPKRKLHVVTPRGPLPFPGGGFGWYETARLGYPDKPTFDKAYPALAALHDGLWERTGLGPEQTILGGFSMGTVMSYALGLGSDRPAPKGILAMSGFMPTVEGWEPNLTDRTATRALIVHGLLDGVIDAKFARHARDVLEQAGFDVEYLESRAAHHIDPRLLPDISDWITRVLTL
ncbi:MAG TPA: phospholipase [Solirubrobacteraceae bacterium]|nr:phospholipase [Solirubrobacteraceae bacterium]